MKKKIINLFRSNCYFILFLLVAFAMASCIMSFCKCIYGTNDDFFLSMIASGSYGEEYSHCLIYSSSLLGWIIRILNTFLKGNYFMIIQYLLLIFSTAIFASMIIFKTNNFKIAFVSFLLLWIIMYFTIFTKITYTTTAGVVSIIGMLGVIVYFDNNFKLCTISSVVCFFGYLYRLQAFLLVIPFAMMYLLFLKKQKLNRRIVLYLLMVFVVAGATHALDSHTYKDEKWQEYLEQNTLRTILHDYPTFCDKENPEINWTDNDYKMFYSWKNDSFDKFGVENISKIASVSSIKYKNSLETLSGIKYFFVDSFSLPQTLTIVLIMILSFLINGNLLLKNFCVYLVATLISGYLIFKGRYPLRVSFVVMFSMVMVAFFNILDSKNIINVDVNRALIGGVCLLFFLQCYNNKNTKEIGIDLFEQIRKDKDHFYVLDGATTGRTLIYKSPCDIIPEDYMDNFVFIGGWAYPSPLSENKCNNNGGRDALTILGLREDVFYVTYDYEDPETVAQFLRENYHLNIKTEIVDVLDGGHVVYIFKRV